MPYMIMLLKVRKFHQPTANCFGTARQKTVGGGGGVHNACIGLNQKPITRSLDLRYWVGSYVFPDDN